MIEILSDLQTQEYDYMEISPEYNIFSNDCSYSYTTFGDDKRKDRFRIRLEKKSKSKKNELWTKTNHIYVKRIVKDGEYKVGIKYYLTNGDYAETFCIQSAIYSFTNGVGTFESWLEDIDIKRCIRFGRPYIKYKNKEDFISYLATTFDNGEEHFVGFDYVRVFSKEKIYNGKKVVFLSYYSEDEGWFVKIPAVYNFVNGIGEFERWM